MICSNCGAQNAPESEYCFACGQELKSPLAVHESVCAKHPGRPAVSVCCVCGIELCEVCERFLAGSVYCQDCIKRPAEEERTARIPASIVPAAGRAATIHERAMAAFVDILVLALGDSVMAVIFWTMTNDFRIPMSPVNPLFKLFWVIICGWTMVYFIGSISSTGQTPGMSALDLAVLQLDGTVPGKKQAACRFFATFLSVIFVFGMFMPLWDPKRRMWHDKIAQTVMVKVG